MIEIITEDCFVEKNPVFIISCDTTVASFSKSRQVTIMTDESNNVLGTASTICHGLFPLAEELFLMQASLE